MTALSGYENVTHRASLASTDGDVGETSDGVDSDNEDDYHDNTGVGVFHAPSTGGSAVGYEQAVSTQPAFYDSLNNLAEQRPRAQTAWDAPVLSAGKGGRGLIADAKASAEQPQPQPLDVSTAVKHGYENVQVKVGNAAQQQQQPLVVHTTAIHSYVNVQDAAALTKSATPDIGPTALPTVDAKEDAERSGGGKCTVDISANQPVAKVTGGKGIQRSADARKGSVYDGFGDESGGGGGIQRQSGARQGSVYTGFEGIEEDV
jgi:hypothetical protein